MSIEVYRSTMYKVLNAGLLVALIVTALFTAVALAVFFIAPGSNLAHLYLSLDFGGFSLRSPLTERSVPSMLMPVGSTVAMGAVAFVSAWLLRLVVLSMRKGSPFQVANVRRLRIIGWVWVVQAYLRQAANWSFARALLKAQGSALNEILELRFNILPQGLFAAVGLLVIAQVFNFGCQLQREHDETV